MSKKKLPKYGLRDIQSWCCPRSFEAESGFKPSRNGGALCWTKRDVEQVWKLAGLNERSKVNALEVADLYYSLEDEYADDWDGSPISSDEATRLMLHMVPRDALGVLCCGDCVIDEGASLKTALNHLSDEDPEDLANRIRENGYTS